MKVQIVKPDESTWGATVVTFTKSLVAISVILLACFTILTLLGVMFSIPVVVVILIVGWVL